jgi:hypothetical protein
LWHPNDPFEPLSGRFRPAFQGVTEGGVGGWEGVGRGWSASPEGPPGPPPRGALPCIVIPPLLQPQHRARIQTTSRTYRLSRRLPSAFFALPSPRWLLTELGLWKHDLDPIRHSPELALSGASLSSFLRECLTTTTWHSLALFGTLTEDANCAIPWGAPKGCQRMPESARVPTARAHVVVIRMGSRRPRR